MVRIRRPVPAVTIAVRRREPFIRTVCRRCPPTRWPSFTDVRQRALAAADLPIAAAVGGRFVNAEAVNATLSTDVCGDCL